MVTGGLAMTASKACAQVAAKRQCPVPLGGVNVLLPSGLPPALRETMGDIALPGEPFDTTDVYIKGHKHRRYIFVWNISDR